MLVQLAVHLREAYLKDTLGRGLQGAALHWASACMHGKHLRLHLPHQVSDDRFLSLLAKATRLAELAQQAKPQNRKPVVPQETAASKAQKQRHGQEVAEKASAKLALKARLGMQVGPHC